MSRATSASRLVLSILLISLLAGMTRAQGEFVNFEAPQVKPIDVATIGEGSSARDLLLVCNTPDNSVEIYDANPPHRFVQRVPVGLAPVTVRYNEELGRFFTCNFVGDSVSIVRLESAFGPSQPAVIGQVNFRAVLERTDYVGDEPCDISFLGPLFVAITLNSKSGVTVRRTHDLSLIVPIHDLTFKDPSGFRFAAKQPRMIQALPDGRVFALNFMGGHKAVPSQVYDLDLYVYDPTSGDRYPYRIAGGMGTTNHSFAVTRDGSRTFVVGTRAENMAAVGVKAVSQLKTGFVGSYLWVGVRTVAVALWQGLAYMARNLWVAMWAAIRTIAVPVRYAWLGISIPFRCTGTGVGIAFGYTWLLISTAFRYVIVGLAIIVEYLGLGISAIFVHVSRATGTGVRQVGLWGSTYTLYVTENGTFDPEDVRKPAFLIDHIAALDDAIRGGLDVRGYFAWSLVDNFEWAEGWATPFGLLALDRATQRRTPRGSADAYAAICRARGIPIELAPTVYA